MDGQTKVAHGYLATVQLAIEFWTQKDVHGATELGTSKSDVLVIGSSGIGIYYSKVSNKRTVFNNRTGGDIIIQKV